MSFGIFSMHAAGQGLATLGNYIYAQKKAESDRQWQEYNNKMTRLADAQNQNSLTVNENVMQERMHEARKKIDMVERATSASAEVAAAATGTVGRSVNMVLFDISRSAAGKREDVDREQNLQEMQIDQKRMQSAFSAQAQLDLRNIPEPNPATYLMGLTSDIGKLWKQHGSPRP